MQVGVQPLWTTRTVPRSHRRHIRQQRSWKPLRAEETSACHLTGHALDLPEAHTVAEVYVTPFLCGTCGTAMLRPPLTLWNGQNFFYLWRGLTDLAEGTLALPDNSSKTGHINNDFYAQPAPPSALHIAATATGISNAASDKGHCCHLPHYNYKSLIFRVKKEKCIPSHLHLDSLPSGRAQATSPHRL